MTGLRPMVWIPTMLLASVSLAQSTLSIQCPPALKSSIDSIVSEYAKAHPKVKVQVNKSNKADVTISDEPGGRIVTQDRLVVVCKSDYVRLVKFAHLGLSMNLAIPDPSTSVGHHIMTTLNVAGEHYGKDWLMNVQRNLKLTSKTSADAVSLVKLDKAAAAIVNSSSAVGSGLKIIPIPVDIADEIIYSAVGHADFIEFLFTKGNQMRLESHGFTSILRPPPELVVSRKESETRLFFAALNSMPQASVKMGSKTVTGASISGALNIRTGTIKFVSADGSELEVTAAEVRRRGGVMAPMGDGNFQIAIPGKTTLRWLRRIMIT